MAGAQVRWLEMLEEEEILHDLVGGRVRVKEVLEAYGGALFVVVGLSQNEEESLRFSPLTEGSDGLSKDTFVPESLYRVIVVRKNNTNKVVPKDRVQHLLDLFSEQLVVARQPVLDLPPKRTADVLPLLQDGNLDRKLGDYFFLAGRDSTIKMQLEAAARIFETFMSLSEDVRDCDSLLMAVGYPGVGKTTLGRETTALLRKLWDQSQSEVDAILERVLVRQDLVVGLKTRIENSKDFHCRMYRCLEAADNGLPLPEEDGLGPAQLLALNSLFGALKVDGNNHQHANFVHSYTQLLSVLQSGAPGVKEHLMFSDVVAFIRRALGIPDGKQIFLSWFFYEANISRPAPGQTVCWFQQMMSQFVHWLHSHRRGDTFVVATAATTRSSVATLQNTASGKAKSVFIPMNPLSNADCESVVLKFLERLAKTVGVDGDVVCSLTDGVRNAVALSGGNPRMLSYILTAFCSRSAAVELAPGELLMQLCKPLKKEDMQRIVTNAWALINDSYYAGYRSPDPMQLVLKAMQASLLGRQVQRTAEVLPGKFPDTWGDLEGEGLVGLISDDMPSAVRIGNFPGKVRFSAVLLRYIFSLGGNDLSDLLPPLEENDWKVKEKADLYTIMFFILMQQQISGEATFKLSDILPEGWYVPVGLRGLEFRFPSRNLDWSVKQAGQLKTSASFWKFMTEHANSWAFIGPHNYGADSWLRLYCVTKGVEMLFVFESKSCGCPQVLPVVKYSAPDGIIEKSMKDLKPMIVEVEETEGTSKKRKVALPSALKKFGLDQVVFFYVSDQDISDALREHKAACSQGRASGVASRLIITEGHPSESPFCLMASVRHMMVFGH